MQHEEVHADAQRDAVRKPVSPAEITVQTSTQIDGANKKVQAKTRTIEILGAGTERDWTDIHVGADCP